MNIKTVAFCALMMAASPAAAEPWGYYGAGGYYGAYGAGGYAPPVPLYEVQAALRANGLQAIMRPVLSPPYIVVRAVGTNGELVRVLLNARWGNIVSITPLPPAPIAGVRPGPYEAYPPRAYEPYPRYGDARPDLKVEPPPPPMGPSDAAAPPTMQERRPPAVARTPMPRPRPPMTETTAAAKATPELAQAPHAAPAASPPAATTGKAADSEKSFPPAAPLE